MALKRLTRQRKAILEVVRQARHHPDAAWIYQEVRKRVPKVSLGTIYRNLEALVAEGYLVPITKAGRPPATTPTSTPTTTWSVRPAGPSWTWRWTSPTSAPSPGRPTPGWRCGRPR